MPEEKINYKSEEIYNNFTPKTFKPRYNSLYIEQQN